MSSESICIKKDKRLLVLLALGAIILLLDHNFIPFQWGKGLSVPSWVESQVSSGNNVFRLSTTEPRELQDYLLSKRTQLKLNGNEITRVLASLNEHKAISIDAENNKTDKNISMPTPRLSFFLGLPFAINHASYNDLLLLPGIGPYLARNIIHYREKQGLFSGIMELKSVPGVGPKVISRISPVLVFD